MPYLKHKRAHAFAATALAGLALLPAALLPSAGKANPLNGQVTVGQATITNTAPNTLTIQQTTPQAAINWQSFNIAPNETTNFVQPSSSATALNRVMSPDPSTIAGRLNANGNLILMNPNGVVFNKGAQVNVNSLLATTANISDENFRAGRMIFDQPSPNLNARIVNNGNITVAQKGLAALVGPGVANNGVISAKLGKVVLGGAQTYTLDFYGDGLLQFDIGSTVNKAPLGLDGKPISSLVSNTGLIDAPGGRVLMTATAAAGILDSVVNNTGRINAPTYAGQTGSVTLDAGAGNTARLSGSIDVSGLAPGQTGGNAVVTGGAVALAGTASIDARGNAGGGTVAIGGGSRGKDPKIRNAQKTEIASGAKIDASATGNGNGGTIAVWADTTTAFDGTLMANAGPDGGNGGLIETSGGLLTLGTHAAVSAGAPRGKPGTWLLDPLDLTIDANAATIIANTLGGSFATDVTELTDASTASGVAGNLAAGTGNINVNAAISWDAPTTLTLSAYNNVNINAPITVTGTAGGALVLISNNASVAANNGASVNIASAITIGGSGQLTLTTNGNTAGPVFTMGAGSAQFTGGSGSGAGLTIIAGAPSANDTYTLLYGIANSGSPPSGTDLQIMDGSLGKFALAQPIDASGAGTFTGSVVSTFPGTFNGLGNTISNLTINSAGNAGLFGSIGLGGTVASVGILGGTIKDTGINSASGGLAAGNSGTIRNSYSTATIDSSTGTVTTGGLVGSNGGTITTSFAAGTVNGGTGAPTGGLVGNNLGTITQSYATGAVSTVDAAITGGLVGQTGGTISNAYATGAVSCAGAGCALTGGFVGEELGSTTIANAYSTGTVTASSGRVGGFAGGNLGTLTNTYWDTVTSGTGTGDGGNFGTGSPTGVDTATLAGSAVLAALNSSGTVWANANNQITPYLLNNPGPFYAAADCCASPTPPLYNPVSTAAQLQAINNNLSGNYALINNIDLGSTANFTPIGQGTAYSGTFNGLGYVVTNLTINSNPGSLGDIGLFGDVSGSVRNLGLIDATINLSSSVSNVGGLVGQLLSGGNLSGVYVTGTVTATNSDHAGGLVGFNFGTIQNAYTTGTVTGGSGGAAETGGLVGASLAGLISNSYSLATVSGRIVGGLIGFDGGLTQVQTVYAAGAVSGTGAVGGLIGIDTAGGGSVNSAFWVSDRSPAGTQITGSGSIPGGFTISGTNAFTSSSYQQGTQPFTFTTTPGATGNNWVIADVDGTLNNAGGVAGATMPMLASEYATLIQNPHQLQLVAMASTATYTLGRSLNASGTGSSTSAATGTDVWTTTGFAPIGGNGAADFTGGFNGAGNTISGLTITSAQSSVGLFGQSSGTIQNVGLTGGSIKGTALVARIGALVGDNAGPITNSYATADVNASGLGSWAGGLVGFNGPAGTITGSHAGGAVSGILSTGNQIIVGGLAGQSAGAIDSSYATGAVSAQQPAGNGLTAGGLLGINTGTVTRSYATGAVSATSIGSNGVAVAGGLVGDNGASAPSVTLTSVYATGAVSVTIGNNGSAAAGGLVGYNPSGGSITDAYATGVVGAVISGTATVMRGGLVGLNAGSITHGYYDELTTGQPHGTQPDGSVGVTTTTLQAALPTFTDPTKWGIIAGKSYPYLCVFAGNCAAGLTPQVVSGTVFQDQGTTPAAGSITVTSLVYGNTVGTASTGVNGYYSSILPFGTVPLNGAVLTYAQNYTTPGGPASGATLVDQIATSVVTADIYANTLRLETPATLYSSVTTSLANAQGTNAAATAVVAALPNLTIDASAPVFFIDTSISVAGIVTLNAAGAIAEPAPAGIFADTLTGKSAGGALFLGFNTVNTFGPWTDADAGGSLGLAYFNDNTFSTAGTISSAGPIDIETTASGSITVNGTVTGVGSVKFDAAEALTINGAVTATGATPGSTVTVVTEGGELTQDPASVITADNLVGKTAFGSFDLFLDGANKVGIIGEQGALSCGCVNQLTANKDLRFNNTIPLTVSNLVQADNVKISTTGTNSNLTISGTVATPTSLTANPGNTLTFDVSGTITDTTNATVFANTLTGHSTGDALLKNAVYNVDALNTFTVDSGSFWLNATPTTGTLTVAGPVTAPNGVTIATVAGSGGNISLTGTIEADLGTVALFSDQGISQTGGMIVSSALEAVTHDSNLFLTSAKNAVTGNVTLTVLNAAENDRGTGFISFTDSTGFTVAGIPGGGKGNLEIGVASGSLATLNAGGKILETGVMNVPALGGSSVGGASFTGANQVANVGIGTGFSFTNTGGGTLALNNAQGLKISGPLSNVGGDIVLTAAGSLTQTGNITATNFVGTTKLDDGGTISLGGDNKVSGNITLTALNTAGSDLATPGAPFLPPAIIFNNTSAFTIASKGGKLTGVGTTGTATLSSTGGGISEVAGAAVVASTFVAYTEVASPTLAPITLDQSGNAVTNLTLTVIQTTGVGEGITRSLSPAPITFVSGTGFAIAKVSGGGIAAFEKGISTTGTATLSSGGAITEVTGGTPGIITAGTLTGGSVGGATMTNANLIGTFGPWADTGAGATGISLTNAQALATAGTISSVSGPITLTTTAGGLTLGGPITATGHTVTLTSAAGISQTAGAITAGTLTGGSVGAVDLGKSNSLVSLGAFTTGGNSFTLLNGPALAITGSVTATGATVSLTSSTGAVTQTGGVITAGNLQGGSVGGASFPDANAATTFGPWSDTGGGAITYASGITFSTAGLVSTTGNVSLSSTAADLGITIGVVGGDALNAGNVLLQADALGLTGSLTATGTVTLLPFSIARPIFVGNDGGPGTFSVAAGLVDKITANTLVIGNAATGPLTVNAAINPVNIPNLDLLSSGTVSLGANMTVSGTVTLTAGGAISQTAGAIAANNLTGTSVGGASFGQPNLVTTFGAFTNTGAGPGGIVFTNGKTLTTAGTLSTVNGPIELTTTAGDLNLTGNVTAPNGVVSLNSAGSITQTAGTFIDPAGLLVRSVGNATVAGDKIDLFAANITGAGSTLTFTNNQSFAVDTVTDDFGTVKGVTTNNGNTALSTSAGNITLNQNITTGAGTVSLVAPGTITEVTGLISGASLSGSSVGGASFGLANLLGSFAGFTNTGSGDVTLVNAQTLAAGVLSNTVGNISLTANGGGFLAMVGNVDVNGTTGIVTLKSDSGVTQPAGVITAGSLSVTSGASVDLAAVNAVNILAASVTGLGNSFDLQNGKTLTVGTVGALSGVTTDGTDGSAANILLATTAGDINITKPISTNGANGNTLGLSIGKIGLQSAGNITLSGGANLVGFAVEAVATGAITLDGSANPAGNRIGANDNGGGVAQTGGTFAAQSTGTGNITFINQNAPILVDQISDNAGFGIQAGSLSMPLLNGVSTTSGNITLVTSGAGDIGLNQNVAATNGSVTVAATGNLSIGAGATVSGGSATLATLGNFTNLGGPGAVTAGPGGKWLVYSTSPLLDTDGGLTTNFIQYGANYDIPTLKGTAPAAAGNGFLYSLSPTLTLTSVTKTYDSTTALPSLGTAYTATGAIGGDVIAFDASGVAGQYNSAPNVGIGLSVDVSKLVANATNPGKGGIPVFGYTVAAVAGAKIGTITPAALAIAAVTDTKTYDATTASTKTPTASGLVGGDTVTGLSQLFDSINAGARTLSVTPGFSVNDGNGGNNYTVSIATASGTINPAALTISALTETKTYDATTASTKTPTVAGLVGGDTVTGLSQLFDSINAGPRTLSVTGGFIVSDGNGGKNYTVSTATASGAINPAALTISALTDTKTYDATTASTKTPTVAGLVGGDTVTGLSQLFDSINAGPRTLSVTGGFTVSDGNAGKNYTVSTATASGTINPAALTISALTDTKTYDATNASTPTPTVAGLVGGDKVTGLSQLFDSANAGPRTLSVTGGFTVSDGNGGNNYTVSTATASGTINPAALTAAIIGNPTKDYDGTAAAALISGNYTLSGFVGGQGATVTQPTGTYATPNAGTGVGVSASLAAGNFAANPGTLLSNYILPTTALGTGTITPAELTAALTGNPTKIYDGSTIASLAPANYTLTGFVAGQGASVTQTAGTYASANAGTGIGVSATLAAGDFAANPGTLLSNYVLPTNASGTGTISPAALTAAIIGNPTKIYDGTTAAVLASGNYTLTGFVAGQGATIAQPVGTYASANAGTGIGLTATLAAGDFAANPGTLLSNYVLPASALGTGMINQAPLAVAITATPTKIYDGTTVANLTSGSYSLTGFVAGQGASITKTTGTYTTSNVGGGLTLSTTLAAGDFAANAGTLLSNYLLPTTAAGTGTINQAPLTATIIGNPTKTYDGTTAATLTSGNFSLTGFVAGQGATIAQPVGTYASANAGNAIGISANLGAGNFTAGAGTLLSNYVLPITAAGTGTINQAPLTAAIIGTPTKDYDSTTAATLTSANFTLTGFIAGQGATIAQPVGIYASANVGNGIGLSANLGAGNFIAGAGTLLSNYQLPATALGVGAITPAELTVGLTGAVVKLFDGTTVASLAPGNYLLKGVFAGDVVSLNNPPIGAYAFPDPGTGIMVSVGGLGISGASAGNYRLTNLLASGEIGTILPLPVPPPLVVPPVVLPPVVVFNPVPGPTPVGFLQLFQPQPVTEYDGLSIYALPGGLGSWGSGFFGQPLFVSDTDKPQ